LPTGGVLRIVEKISGTLRILSAQRKGLSASNFVVPTAPLENDKRLVVELAVSGVVLDRMGAVVVAVPIVPQGETCGVTSCQHQHLSFGARLGIRGSQGVDSPSAELGLRVKLDLFAFAFLSRFFPGLFRRHLGIKVEVIILEIERHSLDSQP
jgi:hypothetical protein